MLSSVILDILLVLLLLSYTVFGFRAGLLISIGGIIGIILGAIAAFFAIPLVGSWVTNPDWRVPVILAAVLVLIVAGQTAGTAVGRVVRRGVDRTPLRIVDRVLGAAVNLVVAALVLSMLAFSIGSLGVPVLSQALASSQVIKAIDGLTPDPVKVVMAQLRSIVTNDALPRVINSLGPGVPVKIPDSGTNTAAQNRAAASVVKVTGTAYQCGQTQTGSGFVVAPGRVVTNAHVVAGVSEPVVEVSGGAWRARIVFFDPAHDLAVLAVSGLSAPTLHLDKNLRRGDPAVFDGYPLGGPFQSKPAAVQSVSTANVPNIYGKDPRPLQLYYLAAQVQNGNSGGPLLDRAGKVVGVVFAKSADQQAIGYALTTTELAPVVAKAPSLSAAVSPGHCTGK